jgi:GAF domain-containing protein
VLLVPARADMCLVVARALRTGAPQLATDIPPDALGAIGPDPAHREIARALDDTSYLVLPLVARGRTLGAL